MKIYEIEKDQLSWDSEPGAGRGESYLSCHPRPWPLIKYRFEY